MNKCLELSGVFLKKKQSLSGIKSVLNLRSSADRSSVSNIFDNVATEKNNLNNFILHDISFNLNFGEILTIVGPNGGGKTTLLKCILGLERRYSGIINLLTKHIGYMPQIANINTNFPIKVKDFLRLSNLRNQFNLLSEFATHDNKNFVTSAEDLSGFCVNDQSCDSAGFDMIDSISDFSGIEKSNLKNLAEKMLNALDDVVSKKDSDNGNIINRNDCNGNVRLERDVFSKKMQQISSRNFTRNDAEDIKSIYDDLRKISTLYYGDIVENSIENVLNFVKIKNLANSYMTNLSLGELQKVLFANAIISSPKLLIFDEPTQGLDLSSQVHFFDMLIEINYQQKTTIVIVSHDLQNVLSHSDKVLCINKKIQCFGQPTDVCSDLNAHNISHYYHKH